MDEDKTSNNVSFKSMTKCSKLMIVFRLLLLSFHLCRSPLHTPIFDVIYLTWFHHYLAKHIYFYITLSLRLLVFSCDLCAMGFFFFSFLLLSLSWVLRCVCVRMSSLNVVIFLEIFLHWLVFDKVSNDENVMWRKYRNILVLVREKLLHAWMKVFFDAMVPF